MRSVGEYLKSIRQEKGISRKDLERETKIRMSFIDAIEEGHWEMLPDYTVVNGFVKNIASYLGEDSYKILAMLRRDYPPKVVPINPKPDVSKSFSWSPKLTFLMGMGMVVLVLVSYLSFQYINFIKAPGLTVSSPTENELLNIKTISVTGKTDPESTIKINNQPVLVSESGDFVTEIEVSKETAEIIVIAKSRAGKETVVARKIRVELK
jgi:cytoskeletal protein RodZ